MPCQEEVLWKLAHLRKIFSVIDTDHSGFIDKRELFKYMRREGKSDSEINSIFKEADIDKSGKLSIKEFFEYFKNNGHLVPELQAGAKLSSKDRQSMYLHQTFQIIDTNGSGFINYNELKTFLKGCCYYDYEINDIFKSADKNGDQRLSFEEFCSVFKSN